MTSNQALYHYKANVIAVYDGDTITVDIDLGLYTWICKQKLRLAGIDAPELRGDERSRGIIARDALAALILNETVVIATHKDTRGKYGRWLATVWLGNCNVNAWMIREGHAQVYHASR